ncbi:bacteriorhodopsin [Geodermatophilus bullaregiensis]|uniref:bacteriorhodopsin n=1 Tax=Geodermatophilus bullaregiensis TaxID=1564160 RepID=UPI0027DC1495|nr:bacteriorhodopsin [Geodermatophilus bullaregiensis]MBM7808800.1 bacteriorhodopsin [Geodermatophilus bullaregiensis]
MDVVDTPTPELQTMSLGLYDLVHFALMAAGFSLLAYFLYSWASREEVGRRYRPAVYAGLCLAAVATVSYLVLFLKWDTGFDLQDGLYRPNAEARFTGSTRYPDWAVTVPLLTVELLAVCSLAGSRARNLRASAMAAAFLMILTGYLGAQVVADGRDRTALVVWGLVSTAFFAYLCVALIGAVRASLPHMGREAAVSLRNATIVLLSSFGVYPLVYAIPVFVDVTPAWSATVQVAYSTADVIAKVGFGLLVHKVAVLRTAEDVRAGVDTHPEPVWVSNVHESDGVLPELDRVSSSAAATLRGGHDHHGHDHHGRDHHHDEPGHDGAHGATRQAPDPG